MVIEEPRSYQMEELRGKNAHRVLKQATRSLKGHWWLSAGTLLGFVREGDFIPHDTDIDVGILGEIDRDYLPKTYELIRYINDDDGRQMQSAYIHNPTNIIFDILHYYPMGDDYFNRSEKGRLIRPKSLIDTLGTVEHGEQVYPVPHDTDKYLTMWYGDWRTPVKGGKTVWRK